MPDYFFWINIKYFKLLQKPMLPLSVTLSHYKRRDIQEEIIIAARNREIAVRYHDKFGPRPDVLNNPADILELAKQKATSFHSSEELWSNPLQLNPNMKRHEIDALRIGWDLVLDIDCKVFEYSRIAADLVIKALKFHGVKGIYCKFSGNKGFHIGVPFESFPAKIENQEISGLFPDAARRIALYIKEMIKKNVSKDILKLEKGKFENVMEKTGKNAKEITRYEKNEWGDNVATLNAEPFLDIDTVLISSRHLFRMPYSLHEKSGLVSVPLDPDKVSEFEKKDAEPENLKISKFRFLDKENTVKNEARDLIVQAFDFNPDISEIKIEEKRKFDSFENAVPEQIFPPCIKLGLSGLKDGKKRFVFILLNFLVAVGWSYEDIEKKLKEWNQKNPEPLREVTLLGQLRYHKAQKKKILPPNCNNIPYYVDIGICKPDNLCSKIKNPVNYTQRKALFSEKLVKVESKKN